MTENVYGGKHLFQVDFCSKKNFRGNGKFYIRVTITFDYIYENMCKNSFAT